MKRVILPIAILAGAIGLAAVLISTPKSVEEAAPEVLPVTVRVMEANRESTGLTVKSQGKVQAAQQVNLSAPVAGIVSWVSPSLEAGGYVEQGQTLIRLDAGDYETAMARAQAGLQQAQAEAEHAQAELQRIRNLAEQRLVSQAELQNAERGDAVAQARLADAEAGVRQAQMDLERTRVHAPFNAMVQAKEVEVGQFLNRAASVAVLYGADSVEVRVPLAIRQLGYLDLPLGQRGELPPEVAPEVILTGMYGGKQHQWQGRLVRIEAAIDETSNSVQSIIRVHQPAVAADAGKAWGNTQAIPLPIGLYVQADIVGRGVDDVFALPRSVIRNNNQVLVVDAENKMYFRDVEIYRLEEDRVLVSGGLAEGELICTSPIQAVYDGMSVQPVMDLI
jgi:RND family efflux transporter MFP subunit